MLRALHPSFPGFAWRKVPLLCFGSLMVSIDYREFRVAISMEEVLDLIEFTPTVARGNQLRGPCPLHGSKTPTSTSCNRSRLT